MSGDDRYNPIDMKSLLCFATMARLGSLTRASIDLGISDSAVSQRIKSLEEHLGQKLYEARGGKIKLTEAGESTSAFAARIFDQLADFEDDLQDNEFRGTISIGAAGHIFRYQLSDIVHAFRKQYPQAKLHFWSGEGSQAVELVRRNEIDLGIISDRETIPKDMVFHPWRTFSAFIIMPVGHPLARKGKPTIQDLMNEQTLMDHPQIVGSLDTQALRVKRAMDKAGLPFNVTLEAGNIETVKYYVAQGHGLAIINGSCLVPGDERIFHTIEIPHEFDPKTEFGVLLRRDKHQSTALKTLLTLLGMPTD